MATGKYITLGEVKVILQIVRTGTSDDLLRCLQLLPRGWRLSLVLWSNSHCVCSTRPMLHTVHTFVNPLTFVTNLERYFISFKAIIDMQEILKREVTGVINYVCPCICSGEQNLGPHFIQEIHS